MTLLIFFVDAERNPTGLFRDVQRGLSNMITAIKVSVYEFSDHVRAALQQAYPINAIEPAPECIVHIRRDCEAFGCTRIYGRHDHVEGDIV